jgi:hypothetical protein
MWGLLSTKGIVAHDDTNTPRLQAQPGFTAPAPDGSPQPWAWVENSHPAGAAGGGVRRDPQVAQDCGFTGVTKEGCVGECAGLRVHGKP